MRTDDEEDDILEEAPPEVLKRFIDQYKEHIEDVSYFIEDREWGVNVSSQLFAVFVEMHDTEWKIMSNIAKKLEDFIKEAESNLHRKFARDFINLLKGLLDGYIDRANRFRKLNKWAEIEDPDYMELQLKFQEILLSNIHTLRKTMGKINLDEAKGETKKIPIHGDKIIPFLMKPIIEKRFPKQFS